MFDAILFIALIVLIAVFPALWRVYKRETARKATDREAGRDKRVGRHRAKNQPVMKWRG